LRTRFRAVRAARLDFWRLCWRRRAGPRVGLSRRRWRAAGPSRAWFLQGVSDRVREGAPRHRGRRRLTDGGELTRRPVRSVGGVAGADRRCGSRRCRRPPAGSAPSPPTRRPSTGRRRSAASRGRRTAEPFTYQATGELCLGRSIAAHLALNRDRPAKGGPRSIISLQDTSCPIVLHDGICLTSCGTYRTVPSRLKLGADR